MSNHYNGVYRIANQKRGQCQRAELLGGGPVGNVDMGYYIRYSEPIRAVEAVWRADTLYRMASNREPFRLLDFQRLSRLSHESHVAARDENVCTPADGYGQCSVAGIVQDEVSG